MSTTPIHTFKVADSPFDDTDAEIVLRSSDNVDFYVHKWPLSRASSVFKDMFSIPSPNNPSNADELKDGIPIVHMTENSAVLDTILRLSYPTDKPSISSELSFVRALSEAMDKYAMIKTFPQTLESVMLEAAAVHPFAVYAIACHYQMFEIANRIARATLRHPLVFTSSHWTAEDLNFMTSFQYHQLLRYRQQSAAAVLEPVQSLKWLQPLDIPGSTPQGPGCSCSSSLMSAGLHKRGGNRRPLGPVATTAYVPNWAVLYLERCEAALQSTPHSDTVVDDSIVLPSILRAAECPVCRSSANGLRLFSRQLEKELRSALDTVRNDMCLPLWAFSDPNNIGSGAATLSSGRAVEEGTEDFLYK